MAEFNLTCNALRCRNVLTEQAHVTSCSHIFCNEHGQLLLKKDGTGKCLACDSKLKGRFDVVLMDLNPSEQYKAMVITGLNPDQILEITSKALSFYMYQLDYKLRCKEGLINKMAEQAGALKAYNSSVTEQYKRDLMQMEKAVKALKHDLQEKEKEIEAHRQQINQHIRLEKKLQSQLDLCKRELITMKTAQKQNEAETDEIQELFTAPKRRNSPYLFSNEPDKVNPCPSHYSSNDHHRQQCGATPFGHFDSNFGRSFHKHHFDC